MYEMGHGDVYLVRSVPARAVFELRWRAASAGGEKPPPMPTPTELKKPEAKKEKDPPLVIDEERLAEKARQAEKLFGIKAEQYKQAVVEATAEAMGPTACTGQLV